MTRITPEQVKAAYEATGLVPARGSFYRPPLVVGCDAAEACGLGVVYYRHTGHGFQLDSALRRDMGWPEADPELGEYLVGFTSGFDSRTGQPDAFCSCSSLPSDHSYRLGFQDGVACAAAVGLPLSPTPSPMATQD